MTVHLTLGHGRTQPGPLLLVEPISFNPDSTPGGSGLAWSIPALQLTTYEISPSSLCPVSPGCHVTGAGAVHSVTLRQPDSCRMAYSQ